MYLCAYNILCVTNTRMIKCNWKVIFKTSGLRFLVQNFFFLLSYKNSSRNWFITPSSIYNILDVSKIYQYFFKVLHVLIFQHPLTIHIYIFSKLYSFTFSANKGSYSIVIYTTKHLRHTSCKLSVLTIMNNHTL